MTTITLELPEEILINFNGINEIRQALYEDFIIAQRQRGNISLGRAAELLGMTYSEFFNRLGEKGLSFINANPKELVQDGGNFQATRSRASMNAFPSRSLGTRINRFSRSQAPAWECMPRSSASSGLEISALRH